MRYKIFEQLAENLEKAIIITEDIIFPYKGFDPRNLYRRKNYYYRTLHKLEKQNFIIKKKDRFYLTLKGKLELLKNRNVQPDKTKKWDGRWRILAFDIPESQRASRRKLREYLRLLGFKMLQKSIWVSPYKIDHKDIVLLFDEKIKEKVLFFEVTKISEEKQLKKRFDL